MSFEKYQHVERIGTSGCNGVLDGEVLVFPKLDGTNGSVWMEENQIRTGSRNKDLVREGKDNHGFNAYIQGHSGIALMFRKYPDLRLFGEWLVPHSLKTYREDAWRRFFVFDVMLDGMYIHYYDYSLILEAFGVDFIPVIAKYTDPTEEDIASCLKSNFYLIEDGQGIGEGVVAKNYDYTNQWGHIRWGKVVSNEFKEKHNREMGAPKKVSSDVEQKLTDKYLTTALIEKTYAKIENDMFLGDIDNRQRIPYLLEKVYHDFVTEEMWEIVKNNKNLTINFSVLRGRVTQKIKQTLPEVF